MINTASVNTPVGKRCIGKSLAVLVEHQQLLILLDCWVNNKTHHSALILPVSSTLSSSPDIFLGPTWIPWIIRLTIFLFVLTLHGVYMQVYIDLGKKNSVSTVLAWYFDYCPSTSARNFTSVWLWGILTFSSRYVSIAILIIWQHYTHPFSLANYLEHGTNQREPKEVSESLMPANQIAAWLPEKQSADWNKSTGETSAALGRVHYN